MPGWSFLVGGFKPFFYFHPRKVGKINKIWTIYIYIIFLIGLVQPSTRIRWFIRVFHHFLRKIFGKRHAGRSGPRTTRSWPRNVADAGETNERRGGFAWQVYGGVHSIYLVGGIQTMQMYVGLKKKIHRKIQKRCMVWVGVIEWPLCIWTKTQVNTKVTEDSEDLEKRLRFWIGIPPRQQEKETIKAASRLLRLGKDIDVSPGCHMCATKRMVSF